MPYVNRNTQSKGKIANSDLVNQTLSEAIVRKLVHNEDNQWSFHTDAYRKKLGLILSILKG